MGKEAVQEAKTGGEIARYVKAPYRASRACMGTVKRVRKSTGHVGKIGTIRRAPSLCSESHEGAGGKSGTGEKAAGSFPRQGQPVDYQVQSERRNLIEQ